MENIQNRFSSCDSDDDVIHIIEENGYDPRICEVGISFLKSENNIMFIMKNTGYIPSIADKGIKLLQSME